MVKKYILRTLITFISVVSILFIGIDVTKAELGTLIHRLLECIVTSKGSFEIYPLVCSVFEEYGYGNDNENCS